MVETFRTFPPPSRARGFEFAVARLRAGLQ
jgi:hypothetical protein